MMQNSVSKLFVFKIAAAENVFLISTNNNLMVILGPLSANALI